MAVLFYRFELFDLLIFWLLTFSLSYFFNYRRLLVHSFALSLTAVVVYAVVYAVLALPAVDRHRYDQFLADFKVGAHRGLALEAPENTMRAFLLSKVLRADLIEFDLELTADGKPIILHDDSVDRTTDGEGKIAEMTWAEVKRLNAAAKFIAGTGATIIEQRGGDSSKDSVQQEEKSAERVPLLEEVLQLGMKLGFKMIIDVKSSGLNLVVPAITQLFQKYPALYNTTAVCSFFPQVVYAVKRADPLIITGHTWRPGFFAEKLSEYAAARPLPWYREYLGQAVDSIYLWSMHNWVWKWTGVNLVLARWDMVDKKYIEVWQRRNIQVVVWTVNDLEQKRHFLHDLKCPFLTDKLSDMQEDLVLLGV